jgi:hypothetical protein
MEFFSMPFLLLTGKVAQEKLSIMKPMKPWGLIAALIFTFGLTSCQASNQTVEPTAKPPGDSFEFFQDGYFQAVLPTWDESPELDADSIYMVYKDGQFIGINRYQNLPEIFANQFLSAIKENPEAFLVQQSDLGGKPLFEFTTRENNQTMRIQAVLDYCQGMTYALIAGGRDTVKNTELFQEVLNSTSCQDPYKIPDLETGKIGLMVNAAEDETWEGYYPALRLAKEAGVQVLHTYLQWAEVEPSKGERFWEWQDALMGYRLHEGFEISLVVNLIHTGVRGPIPEDLQGRAFDDPEFIERFSEFILEVLDRYPVQYLAIGNEVNDYFVSHRSEIPAYKNFFLEVRERIQERYPDIQVAMTFAYHDAETTHSLDIIRELDVGDYLPLTLYIYNPGFEFNRDPQELEDYLERILSLAGEKPVAIVETGWNTSESLSGHQSDQEAYVHEVFRMLEKHREQIEYISWFALHDSLIENSYHTALTFLPPDAPQIEDEEFMKSFVDFLNYFGLLENDGTPKKGWVAFQEEASSYLDDHGEEQ